MFLTEPRPTPYDFHFRLGDIPVRIHPMFWLVALLLGFHDGSTPQQVLLWVVALFISILVHEMGHALTIQYYGWAPSVVLYSFGGLAIHNPNIQTNFGPGRARRGRWTHTFICFAGPLAGFLLAGLFLAALIPTGLMTLDIKWLNETKIPIGYDLSPTKLFPNNVNVWLFVNYMLYINIWWGFVNLLPIYPLDGGQISRELFQMHDRSQPIRNSLILSLVACVLIVILAFQHERRFLAIMFIFLGIQNYQDLNNQGRYGGGNPW
ncbi:hypothetical protein GC197_05565 [bacterium]|nr:hypothetical protein [bacterium]